MSILSLQHFTKRDAAVSGLTIGLLVALLVLLIIGAVLIGVFICLRRRRRAQQEVLPLYTEKHASTSSISSHRRVMQRPTESILVYQEKQALFDDTTSPPASPVPEIRITFPEEYDDSGKRTSGRVVVVRVGETSFGLEPLSEKLPAYEQIEGGRFQSIDLDRIGGLKEKVFEKH